MDLTLKIILLNLLHLFHFHLYLIILLLSYWIKTFQLEFFRYHIISPYNLFLIILYFEFYNLLNSIILNCKINNYFLNLSNLQIIKYLLLVLLCYTANLKISNYLSFLKVKQNKIFPFHLLDY